MTTAVVRPVILTVLMHLFLAPHGVQCLEPEDRASPLSAAFKLPWRDELCCDPLQLGVEGGATHATETTRSEPNVLHHARCKFRNLTRDSQLNQNSAGTCLDIQCRIDEGWENLTCELQRHNQPSGTLSACRTVVSLQQLFEKNKSEVSDPASINPVVYEGEESLVCSFSVDLAPNFVTMVTINISNAMAPPVFLRIPALPVLPSPPVNLSHFQTNKAELIVHWKDPSDFNSGPLRYEVQYSFSITHPTRLVFRQVVSVSKKPRVSLHLEPNKKYTIQVRCSSLEEPALWSNWSKPYFIYLGEVSYIPEQVVARTGEKLSVYCVFNDRRTNASTAVWKLNDKELGRSLSHPVHEWVSQITFHASENGIYDILKCKKNFSIPFSQIYMQGGFIDINCITSGDIDAMECKWTNKEQHTLTLFFEWTSLSCDEMKEKESSGKEVVKSSSSCKAVKSSDKFCTISPLRGSCYKLWMGMYGKDHSSMECSVHSKPIYISPLDHVKPHPPTNVTAKSNSSGVLKVTWVRPKLPVQGLQFQYRFRPIDGENWKVADPLQSNMVEAVVPSMCNVYKVQVRCKLRSGKGYWSDWSESVRSTLQNSKVPERGPDFWRIRQDAPDGNHSNITLLFEPSRSFPVSWKSDCVHGFIVQRQSDGSVQRERISQLSPYSFAWNQMRHTVTVEAFNSRGSSFTNTHMILEKQPKRRCVRSFHVLLINSTCVSLSWSLLDSSSVPQFMVVQWFPQRQQDFKDYDQSQDSWVRLPYTDHPVYIQGVFLSGEYHFHLYPVFSYGEGEAVITSVSRGEPTAYGILMSISCFCIFLLVTLFFSQKKMKKHVWKEVPNPNKCSWAKGHDFKKVDSSDKLFQYSECLQAFPLLLASENISKVIIVDKTPDKAFIREPFVSPTHDPVTASFTSHPVVLCDSKTDHLMESEATSRLSVDELPVDSQYNKHLGGSDSTSQLAVIYAKVLSTDQQPIQLEHSSSRDTGIFSTINSHMLASGTSKLWDLDSCHCTEINQLRHSSSPNTMQEICKTSKQGDGGEDRQEKVLYYLSLKHPAKSEETEEEELDEETKNDLLGNAVLPHQNCPLTSHPLLNKELKSVLTRGFPSLYMPQCRTAPCAGQLSA